jgi:hypothetical protein
VHHRTHLAKRIIDGGFRKPSQAGCQNLATQRLDRIVEAGSQPAQARNLPVLLRARRERPSRRATKQRHEIAPFHSMTSSAMARRDGGTVRPSIRAVSVLMTSSNLVA